MNRYHYKTSGLDDVYLLNGYEVIKYGDEEAISIHDIDGLHQVISLALVQQEARLTGREFRFLRIELDLSQKALAVWFDMTDQSVANWEKKDRVPQWADMIIRALYVESLGEDSEVRGTLEMLSKVDRAIHRGEIFVKESEEGWALKAGGCS
jgi:putative transcriptional regulator